MLADRVAPGPPRPEAEIVASIRAGGPGLVALSGGVDSGVVAALAYEALGPNALAVTLGGPAVARSEVDRAGRVARAIGIAHRVVEIDPIARPEYRANPSNRCYFCRSVETDALRRVGASRGIVQYLDGVHLDDLHDDRPGLRAMDEAGFVHPLARAGWTKDDVRAAARRRGLPNWDAPSDACLASRVAHGEPISRELLARVEAAESWLRSEGFRRVRVRARGGAARVEVDPDEVARLLEAPRAARARAELGRLGFAPVELDPAGYRASRRAGPGSP
ncbi:MAG TPA: ATP-dependent sacrificial sulfur transferase LarE [Thermoplasmata archaeon]|nr:ATP-dependent sacrificial sulfur transferase LarE [Thermoplasmata archaeon]